MIILISLVKFQCITQHEGMEFDLNRVRSSDLIIVNFNDVYSLGTMAEIATAYERRIPIIGLNENNQDLHPWQTEMLIEFLKIFVKC